jgi:hypothetical protein
MPRQGYIYSFGGPPLMGEWWYLGFFEWMKTVPADRRPKKAAVYKEWAFPKPTFTYDYDLDTEIR